MCQLCGCSEYIRQGKEAVKRRAAEIVKELQITAANVADYEDTELIASLVAPFGSRTDDALQTAAWISDLHAGPGMINRNAQYEEYVQAFRGIFARLPVGGDPKHIATTYHQLEQLNKELDDSSLASSDPATRQALEALRSVHDDPEGRETRLRERYGL